MKINEIYLENFSKSDFVGIINDDYFDFKNFSENSFIINSIDILKNIDNNSFVYDLNQYVYSLIISKKDCMGLDEIKIKISKGYFFKLNNKIIPSKKNLLNNILSKYNFISIDESTMKSDYFFYTNNINKKNFFIVDFNLLLNQLNSIGYNIEFSDFNELIISINLVKNKKK